MVRQRVGVAEDVHRGEKRKRMIRGNKTRHAQLLAFAPGKEQAAGVWEP